MRPIAGGLTSKRQKKLHLKVHPGIWPVQPTHRKSSMFVMTEEWVAFWMQCLSQNIDYGTYCMHSDADDEHEEMAKLEERFPLLAEIYKDFGDGYRWTKDGLDDPKWKRWFDEHKHLFMSSIHEIKTIPDSLDQNTTLLLSVPIQSNIEDTVNDVREYLKSIYRDRSIMPAPQPKYQLSMKAKKPAVGYEVVRQAVLMSTDKRLDEMFMNGDQFSVKQAMIGFLQRNIDELGWSIDPKAKHELMVHGQLSEERFESFRARIKTCRSDLKLLAANTIRGKFPDLTPFESRTWDAFSERYTGNVVRQK